MTTLTRLHCKCFLLDCSQKCTEQMLQFLVTCYVHCTFLLIGLDWMKLRNVKKSETPLIVSCYFVLEEFQCICVKQKLKAVPKAKLQKEGIFSSSIYLPETFY